VFLYDRHLHNTIYFITFIHERNKLFELLLENSGILVAVSESFNDDGLKLFSIHGGNDRIFKHRHSCDH
jgi:hypothetical protein